MISIDAISVDAISVPPQQLNNYSLSAESGSYVFTGIDAGLAYNRIFSAAPGAFTITGIDAEFVIGLALNAEPGSFAVTGNTVDFVRSYVLTADAGNYIFTGVAATLTYTDESLNELYWDMGIETEDDRLALLADDGVSVTFGANTFTAIFDNQYVEVLDIAGTRPVLTMTETKADELSITVDSSLTINGVDYKVKVPQSDGLGMIRYVLEQQ